VVYTVGSDQVQTVWPNARVSLRNLATQGQVSTVSSELGEYLFSGLLPGDYEIQVTLAGFEPAVKPITLQAGGAERLDFQLAAQKHLETVTVSAEGQALYTSNSSGGAPALTEGLLKSTATLSDDFQKLLPLLPGVVRGPDGLLRIKGGRTNQSSALVNTASIADPFTGMPALRLPAVAVQSVRVLSNPFSAEYGRFASGVVDVNTRGGTDRWKWLFENPVPRFRWIDGSIRGVESAKPHLVFSGPLRRDRLYLFQSTSYRFDALQTYSLPEPDNVRVEKMFTSHTQVDWNLTPNHRVTAIATVDPQDIDFANIDTFNPQPVAASYRQRGFFSSATHRWIFANGGFIETLFSAKRFDPRISASNGLASAMTLIPEGNAGAFFDRQDRRTRFYQWSQSLHVRPIEARGRHLFTLGYLYTRATYRGRIERLPITALRPDATYSRGITFATARFSQADRDDLAFFLQDNWRIHPRLALDLGFRLDRDSFSGEPLNAAPRIGFAWTPTRDNRTVLRGGFGVFYDKIPFNVAIFPDFPAQTVTRYAADGLTIVDGPRAYAHRIATADGRLRVPYSLGWTLQLDRELRAGLMFRLGYEHREGFRDFYVDPLELGADAGELRLFNNGRQAYREFLGLLRWQPAERTTLFGSYVYSVARGELNDYNQFFGNFAQPLIRPNQRGPLGHHAPHRVLFWGVVGLPRKVEFVPVLDVHTGFPFSHLDADWDYIGRRNQAGRFPTFVGLDVKIQYPFDFKFRGRRFQFRAGLKVINVLNHFNPRDVQQSVASPFAGQFYNSVPRLFRIEGGFDF